VAQRAKTARKKKLSHSGRDDSAVVVNRDLRDKVRQGPLFQTVSIASGIQVGAGEDWA